MSIRNVELEQKIYEYVIEYTNNNNVSPSIREIANFCNCAPSNVQRYIDRMIEEGKISRRGTRQLKFSNDNDIVHIPLVGQIACGTPILASQNITSYIPMPKQAVGVGEFFALTTKGNSMIEAGINHGDIVIVRIQNYAVDGQIVVALIDEEEATLKRYYFDKKKKMVRLHPENKALSDIYVNPYNLIIQGVAVKIIKNLE